MKWCKICARKKECYGITLKPKCFVPMVDYKTKPNSSEKANNCMTCRFELYCPEMCEGCCEWDSHYEPKDEPQTCEDCIWNVCNYNKAFEDESQTDGILFKGNLKEGDYKLIKTTDGWVLEGEDIVYCGVERGSE